MSHSSAGKAYLITGGASLIGSHIADHLLAGGAAEVRLLDNFSLGTPETIAHLEGESRVKRIRGDILRLNELIDAAVGADGIFALAGFLTIPMAQQIVLGVAVNTTGMVNTLETARLAKGPPGGVLVVGGRLRQHGCGHADGGIAVHPRHDVPAVGRLWDHQVAGREPGPVLPAEVRRRVQRDALLVGVWGAPARAGDERECDRGDARCHPPWRGSGDRRRRTRGARLHPRRRRGRGLRRRHAEWRGGRGC